MAARREPVSEKPDPKDPLLAALGSELEPSQQHLRKEDAGASDLAATGTPVAGRSALKEARRKGPLGFLQLLGPGLITGASDDDPSGIGTYAQVGSQFGFGMLWTALFTFPLMAAVQELCARIALHTHVGLGVAPATQVSSLASRSGDSRPACCQHDQHRR